ncbi:MAG: beta-N-acetylhexosaminidase [Hyphomicrobiales bacterium]
MDVQFWSEDKLAGQMLMAGFEGTRWDSGLHHLIVDLKVGGLILFKRNVESPAQLAELCSSAQLQARDCGQPPLFIAIDQEGGSVARLGPPFTQFPGTPPITNAAEAARFAEITAAELASVGINMNLAPVLDVAPEGFDSIMAGRAFGSNPAQVGRLGKTVIEGLQSRSIMAVAKHFPGIGRTTLDSHLDLPELDADLSSLERCEIIPFRAAIEQKVAGIMLSHILYTRLDPEWPASLSAPIARDLLRKLLGFKGIVITDDLEMGAIARHYGFTTAIRQVLRADIDIALICRSADKVKKAHALMTRKIGESVKRREQAQAAVARIMTLKSIYL